MVDVEQEWAAVRMIQPHLGDLSSPLAKLIEYDDPEWPGHRFDFKARRADGTPLAIEVTNAWPQDWLEADAALRTYCEKHLQPALNDADVPAGYYVLEWHALDGPLPMLRKLETKTLIEAARSVARGGNNAATPVAEALTLRFVSGGRSSAKALAAVNAPEGVTSASQARCTSAVEDCAEKLLEAGDTGMYTILVLVHWGLGSNAAFRGAIEAMPLGEHPQEIWAVDLVSWPHAEPTERLR